MLCSVCVWWRVPSVPVDRDVNAVSLYWYDGPAVTTYEFGIASRADTGLSPKIVTHQQMTVLGAPNSITLGAWQHWSHTHTHTLDHSFTHAHTHSLIHVHTYTGNTATANSSRDIRSLSPSLFFLSD